MTKDEALKLALEALEVGFMGPNIVKYNQAITAIKEALQSNEQVETVVTDWNAVHEKLELVWYRELSADEGLDEIQDLIDTTPPQRKPLTDEQIYDMYNEPRNDAEMLEFARAIEAAHGIKE